MSIGESLLSKLSGYQNILESDRSKGIRWIYRHKGCKRSISEASSSNDRALNCVILVNWALGDIGAFDPHKGLLNHLDGRVKCGSKIKDDVDKYFDIIYMGSTQKSLARSGKLKPGDILIHQGHMAIFEKYSGGTVYCYDAGRGNCDGGNEGATFLRFYGRSPYENMTVNYVVRSKDSSNLPDSNMSYSSDDSSSYSNGTSSGSGQVIARPIIITKRYEYYSGKRNSNVISFTPEYQGMCVDKKYPKYSLSIDDIKNEILYCSGNSKYAVSSDQGQIMGLSSSSPKDLESKSLSMWGLYSSMRYGATLEIMGDPTVKVGTYCAIMVYTKYGFPHHTSGIYYIKEAQDSISGGNFTTTLTLKRVGSGERTAEAYLEGSEDGSASYQTVSNSNQSSVEYTSTSGNTEGGSGVAPDSNVEKAVQWAIGIANDDTHGYLWGGRGPVDYDCSGFVCSAFKQAGFDHAASCTSDMQKGFGAVGFKWIPWNMVGTLKRGDILLNPSSHTEIYIGGNQTVGAHDNFDGKTGDSSGKEISVVNLSGSWEGILRYDK